MSVSVLFSRLKKDYHLFFTFRFLNRSRKQLNIKYRLRAETISGMLEGKPTISTRYIVAYWKQHSVEHSSFRMAAQ